MSGAELERREVPDPITGEVVPLDDPVEVCRHLARLATMRSLIFEFSDYLQSALVEESQRQGTKTLHLGEFTAKVSGGGPTFPDIDALLNALREAGLPEERLAELVRVKREVNMRVLAQVWGANEAYAAAIAAASGPNERVRVSVSPR